MIGALVVKGLMVTLKDLIIIWLCCQNISHSITISGSCKHRSRTKYFADTFFVNNMSVIISDIISRWTLFNVLLKLWKCWLVLPVTDRLIKFPNLINQNICQISDFFHPFRNRLSQCEQGKISWDLSFLSISKRTYTP